MDWWASRINNMLRDLFSPATYIDANGVYLPEAHQMWMLNVEQLLSRIGAILRRPTDQAAQLMLMFPALDILADSFAGGNGAGAITDFWSAYLLCLCIVCVGTLVLLLGRKYYVVRPPQGSIITDAFRVPG